MGMAWFIYPAVMVVTTVILVQTERTNHGILKMLALPVSTPLLCLAKFIVLAVTAAAFILFMTAGYYIAAAAAGALNDYSFILAPDYVLPFAGKLYLASLPMLTVFWLIAVCISTPYFPWAWDLSRSCQAYSLTIQKPGSSIRWDTRSIL